MDQVEKKVNISTLLNIALPMIVSQASETVMLFVDRLFLSHLGKLFISTAMSGGLTSFVIASFFAGVVGYVNAIAAQYFGSGQNRQCARATSQAVFLSLLSYPLILFISPWIKFLFLAAGHGSEQVNLEYTYFQILMFGSILFCLRSSLGGFFLGIGKTRIVMLANVVGMLVNIPCNYVLVFGKFGFPALGITGAAIGTLMGSFTITLILFINYLRERYQWEFNTRGEWKFDSFLMKKIIRFGLPAGSESFLAVFAFNVFVQLMHSYNEDVAAAVTITLNWDLVAFIPMVGLSFATTALVGQQIGAKNHDGAVHAAYLALRVAYFYAGIMMCCFIIFAGPFVTLFSAGFTESDSDSVIPLAALMLRLASIYTLADATNLVFAGALRGTGDTKWIMRTSVLLHWIMAFITFILVKIAAVSPVIVWIFFILFVVVLGTVMFLRFKYGSWHKIKLIEFRD
jgi:MATE family multidrug resistance protein